MIHEIGNLEFDRKLGRFVYVEDWPGDGEDSQFSAWMIEAMIDPYNTSMPYGIRDIRYVERKLDPKSAGYRGKQMIVLGLTASTDYDDMRSPDRFDQDEIKIELAFNYMESVLSITLMEDVEDSTKILSSISMFVRSLHQQKAA